VWKTILGGERFALDLPGSAPRPVDQAVGFLVADKYLLVRIPLQVPLQHQADVAEVADGCHPVGEFHVAKRAPPLLNAIDQVLVRGTGSQ